MPSEPPLRDGVAASAITLPAGGWTQALDFLVARFPQVPRATWEARFARGDVRLPDGSPACTGLAYREGLRLFYFREPDVEPEIPFAPRILHRDDRLLVADKPPFVPVAPVGRYARHTLLAALRRETGIAALAPLHRIDRATRGLVLFSTDPSTRGAYQQLFAHRQVDKTYLAIAPRLETVPARRRSRLVKAPRLRMTEAEGDANSETHIRCLWTRGDRACYELQPITGRQHQLRVHMAALGAPIENDMLYPEVIDAPDDFDRPLRLVARALRFVDPIDGQTREFNCGVEP